MWSAASPPPLPSGGRRHRPHILHAIAIVMLVTAHCRSFGWVHAFSAGCMPPSRCHRQRSLSSPSADVPGERKIARPSLLLPAKKQPIGSDENEKDMGDNALMSMFQRSPGTIVVLPFVLIFGLDLVANIAVVTKRSLEVFLTGEYTVWTPWQ